MFNSYDDKYSAVLLPHSGDIHTLSRRLGGEEKTDGASTLELQRRVLFCRDGVYNNRLWERRAKHKRRAIGRANLTTIPVLAVSLITIVTIAEPIIDSMNLLHKYLLKRMKKKLPIDITIPQKCTLEEYFNVLQHHLIGEAFWPMTEVFIRTNQIYTSDELHKGEVFVSKQQFVETCQGLGLRINDRANVSTEEEVSAEEEEREQESVLNLEEIRLLLEVIRSKASLISTGVQLMHCLLFSVLSVVVGMFYFKVLQDWDYLEAAYFAVVSITSVGLGDYVPNHQEGSVAFWYPYVFIGFGFITVFIGTLATFAEKGREKRLYEIEFRYVHECYNTKRKSWNTNTYWDDT